MHSIPLPLPRCTAQHFSLDWIRPVSRSLHNIALAWIFSIPSVICTNVGHSKSSFRCADLGHTSSSASLPSLYSVYQPTCIRLMKCPKPDHYSKYKCFLSGSVLLTLQLSLDSIHPSPLVLSPLKHGNPILIILSHPWSPARSSTVEPLLFIS